MNRPLSPLEHAGWLIDQGINQNWVVIARLSKKLHGPNLKKALEQIQKMYPPLQCKIKRTDTPEFVTEDVPEIPLTILERKGNDHWLEEADDELLIPFPWDKGPLMRVKVLVSNDRSDLLITVSHIIADGVSSVGLLKKILKIIGNFRKGETSISEPIYKELPSTFELLKRDLKYPPEFLDIFGKLVLLFNKPVEMPGDIDVPPEKRRTRLVPKLMTQKETKELIARCKKENTTVHGAICAAVLQTVAEQIRHLSTAKKTGPLMIGCCSPVNIRHLFKRPVGEEMGNFISDALHYQLIDENTSLWKNARKVKETLIKDLKFGRDIKALLEMKTGFTEKLTPIEMVHNLNKLFPPVLVTNLGVIKLPDELSELIPDSIHYTASINPAAKNGFTVAVFTYCGCLNLEFLYSEPYISKERAYLMIDNTINRLKIAVHE
jgi:NRPS condensation-like uncharacterized protein